MPAASESMSAWRIDFVGGTKCGSAILCGLGPTKFGEVWERFASIGEVDEVGGCCGNRTEDDRSRIERISSNFEVERTFGVRIFFTVVFRMIGCCA
jgi:hypothetical protein